MIKRDYCRLHRCYPKHCVTVCHQTPTAHTHYNIVICKRARERSRDIAQPDLAALRDLAQRVGGQKAGQVVEALQYLIFKHRNLVLYGVEFLNTERLPLYQVCAKGRLDRQGRLDSPAIDWDKWLFIPPPAIVPIPPGTVRTATISHKVPVPVQIIQPLGAFPRGFGPFGMLP